MRTTGTIFIMSLVWRLNPGPPTLEASTLPLGYRVGSKKNDLLKFQTPDN